MNAFCKYLFVVGFFFSFISAHAQTYTFGSAEVIEIVEQDGFSVARITAVMKSIINDASSDSADVKVKILVTRFGRVRILISDSTFGTMHVYNIIEGRPGYELLEGAQRAAAFNDVWLESDFVMAADVLEAPYQVELREDVDDEPEPMEISDDDQQAEEARVPPPNAFQPIYVAEPLPHFPQPIPVVAPQPQQPYYLPNVAQILAQPRPVWFPQPALPPQAPAMWWPFAGTYFGSYGRF